MRMWRDERWSLFFRKGCWSSNDNIIVVLYRSSKFCNFCTTCLPSLLVYQLVFLLLPLKVFLAHSMVFLFLKGSQKEIHYWIRCHNWPSLLSFAWGNSKCTDTKSGQYILLQQLTTTHCLLLRRKCVPQRSFSSLLLPCKCWHVVYRSLRGHSSLW